MSDNTQLTTKTQDLPAEQTANEIVNQGHDRAKQLMQIVNQNQWARNIQGRNYLQVEAWQTLGRFYGYTAITKETKYVDYGGVKGFDARVEILDKDGKVVGGAESSCMADEANWRGKPTFSLKSMAQTRATGKAYRQILSWVAVLAGFEPTPAEEMDGVIVNDRVEKMPNVKRTTFNPTTNERGEVPAFGREAQVIRNTPTDQPASEAQIKFMGKLKSKMTADEVQNYGFLNKREASALIDQLLKRTETPADDLDQEVHNELARQEDDSRWEDTASRADQLDLNSYDGGDARQYQPS